MSFRCQHCYSAFPNPQSTQYSPKKVVTATYAPTAFAGPTVAEERELCDGCAIRVEPREYKTPAHIIEAAEKHEFREQRRRDREAALERRAR